MIHVRASVSHKDVMLFVRVNLEHILRLSIMGFVWFPVELASLFYYGIQYCGSRSCEILSSTPSPKQNLLASSGFLMAMEITISLDNCSQL